MQTHHETQATGLTLDLDQVYVVLGFRCPPFRLTPDTNFFFPHGQYLAALGRLQYGLMTGGISLLTGEIGLGKTLLCRCFIRQMAEHNVRVAYIYNPHQSYASLLANLYADLTGLETPEIVDEGKLHRLLSNTLIQYASEGTQVALVIDEAHALTPELLEGLRLISNIETEGKKLVSLMLFGQNELDEILSRRDMRALKQRISIWYRLRPFGWRETGHYVTHRLNHARVAGDFQFSKIALLALRFYSKGVPRRINQICDRAALLAFASGVHHVSLAMVRKAALEVAGRADSSY